MTRKQPEIPELSKEDLKFTPNTAMEMRFGPNGQARPRAASLPPQELEERKPVNLRRVRNRTEIFFGVIFSIVAALMVAGALYLLVPSPTAGSAPAAPTAEEGATEAAAAQPEEDREVQGVKVRKGLGQ